MSTYKGIHIKKSHRGLFTRKAKEAGSSVQKYAAHVLANKDKYTIETVKQANFARNAKKFKHQNGGNIGSLLPPYDPAQGLQGPIDPNARPQQYPPNQTLLAQQQGVVAPQQNPYALQPIPSFRQYKAQAQQNNTQKDLNPYVKDANSLIRGATFVADSINNINAGRTEHDQYEKAIQPRPYRNNDQQGLNNIPVYTQYGGTPYLPYVDPTTRYQHLQNGGGVPYLPYMNPLEKIDPVLKYFFQNGGITPASVAIPGSASVQSQPKYNFAQGVVPNALDSSAYLQQYNAIINQDPEAQAKLQNQIGTAPNTNMPATSAENARFDAQQFLLNALKNKKTKQNGGIPYLPYQNPLEVYDPVLKYTFQNGGLTSDKAKEILRDGTAQGHKLTPAQKRYFGWVAGGKKQNGGVSAPPTQNAPSPNEYYDASAILQYNKEKLNNQLKAKNPQAYDDYLKGLNDIQSQYQQGKIKPQDFIPQRQAYAQNSTYNEALSPEDVKNTLGSDYDAYVNSLKTVNSYNVSRGQQPLYGTGENPVNDPTQLNYGRRFATMTTNPSIDAPIDQNGQRRIQRTTHVYNPATKKVDVQQTVLDSAGNPIQLPPQNGVVARQYGGYNEGDELDLSPEEYQQLLAQGYELEQVNGTPRTQMS